MCLLTATNGARSLRNPSTTYCFSQEKRRAWKKPGQYTAQLKADSAPPTRYWIDNVQDGWIPGYRQHPNSPVNFSSYRTIPLLASTSRGRSCLTPPLNPCFAGIVIHG